MFIWITAIVSSFILVPAWLIGREDKKFYLFEVCMPLVANSLWAIALISFETGQAKGVTNIFIETSA